MEIIGNQKAEEDNSNFLWRPNPNSQHNLPLRMVCSQKKTSHYEPQHPPCAVTRHLEWLGRLQWVVVIHCDALWYAVICCDCGSMESNSFAIIRQGPPRLVSFCHQRLRWDESRGCCWPFFCHYVLDSVVKTAKTCTWFMWEHCGVSRKARGSIWLNH